MTFFRKSFAASSAVQSVGAAMNVAYLENLSTTTMIDPNPSTLGKAEIKSMEMLSQGLPGIGRGSNRPACFWSTSSGFFAWTNLEIEFWRELIVC